MKNNIKILAIESSCDETAAAVVENGRNVLSNVVVSQIDEHKLYGGVVPEIAGRRHVEAITAVVDKALSEASITLPELSAIAVTYAPGLIGALLVGTNFAKGLSYAADLPIVPVHHLRSHIAANYITNPELKPPFLCLVVSGGHSHIVMVDDYTKMRIIGKTRDDAAGEAFDKVARVIGMPYPGGVNLDKKAEFGDDSAYPMPHPKISDGKYDMSFSGLKTAALNIIHNAEQRGETINAENLSASYRKAVIGCLTDKFLLAAKDLNCKRLVIAGGVSANTLLRRELERECSTKGYELYMPELKYCGDNAAMVGAQAYYEYISGNTAGLDLNAAATRSIELG